jgi:cell division protein FtsW
MSETLPVGARPVEPVEEIGAGWDLILLGTTIVLAVFGLVAVLSASGDYAQRICGNPWHFGIRQTIALTMGCLGGVTILAMPWRWIRASPVPVFVGVVVLLILVQTPLGHAVNGAPRWIRVGPVNLQPSELAKISLSLMLAHHLSRNAGRIRDVVGVVAPAVGLYLLPVLFLVYLQSDLGSIALLAGIAAVALFVAGLEWRWVFASLASALGAVALLIIDEPYRARRVQSFFDPLRDPLGDGYQVVQAWVAMAVGGVSGNGLGKGVAQQGFLPEAQTDMILAVITEEFGAIGWTLVLFGQGILLWRGMDIATRARGMFELVLASCLTAVMAAQAVINSGVVAGLVPPKGLVLPFVSYGSSATITNCLAVALLLRIGLETHRRVENHPTVTRP